jgi:ABC-type polysaccharide/polyol phosphate transport system ATPase subunit
MTKETGEEIERLRGKLSRAVAHRCALQEALAVCEAERVLLRREDGKLRSETEKIHRTFEGAANRAAELHDALAVTLEEKEQLEASLEASRAPEEPAEEPLPEPVPLRVLPQVPAVKVRDLKKQFRIPAHQMETLKEQILHPLRSRSGADLHALRGVSFDVNRGEFLGIAGANGSGKSTLLKILANVYTADEGSVRVAGRVAPFIELGVGLNPELAAFDNVVISGVMMGLDPKEARSLYPEIISFAGLEAFTGMKLKNYSSGMRVRLAFSVMAQVDADILLIDEVLAVGDTEFRTKCLDRLRRLREEGKTIIFVTHSMDTMAKDCDRGILLRDGAIELDGDPKEVARRYLTQGVPPSKPSAGRAASNNRSLKAIEQ